jgi:Mechanosensitive ion channel
MTVKSLVIRGWQRAGSWAALFGTGMGGAEYPKPSAIYAADPHRAVCDQSNRRPFRASIVHTQAGSDVIVPNGTLISGEVINWTFLDRLRAISAQIQVPRGVDQRTATELLRQAASETSGLLKIRARKPISQI